MSLPVVQPNRIDVSSKSKIWNFTTASLRSDLPTLGAEVANKDYVDSVASLATWGTITGNILAQSDLMTLLGDKYDASNPDGFISDLTSFTTTDLSEGTNLYFTDARARSAVMGMGLTSFTNNAGFITDLSSFTTDDLTEGITNLYDKTVTLIPGAGVLIAGTYPTFTISATPAPVEWGSIIGTQSDVNVGGFTNDVGYLTNISGLLISSLTNDVGYITSVAWSEITGAQTDINVGGFTNDVGYLTDLTGLTTDNLTEGVTNLYDKVVTLTEGTNITITGTYPNFTITSAGGGGSMIYPGAGIAVSTGSAWDTSIVNNSANWNTAYSWGNHAGLYDLLGAASGAVAGHELAYDHTLIATALQSETDPIFSQWLIDTPPLYSVAFADLTDYPADATGSLTNDGSGNFTWVDYSGVVSFPGFDTLFNDYGFTDNSTNWDTAYGWGDHAGLYDLIGTAQGIMDGHELAYDHTLIATALQSETDPIFSQWLINTPPLYSETDPVFGASDAAGISSGDISNWDTAYGWGNHADAGYLTGAGGLDTQVQFNDNGDLTGDKFFTWGKDNKRLSITAPGYIMTAAPLVHNGTDYDYIEGGNGAYFLNTTNAGGGLGGLDTTPITTTEHVIANGTSDINVCCLTLNSVPANYATIYFLETLFSTQQGLQDWFDSFTDPGDVTINYFGTGIFAANGAGQDYGWNNPDSKVIVSGFTTPPTLEYDESNPYMISFHQGRVEMDVSTEPVNDTGLGYTYMKADGKLYFKALDNTEYDLTQGTTAETDPVFTAWLATPPNVSIFTNDAGYLTVETDPVFSAWLIATPPLYSESDPLSLHLDQTTPQSVINGTPSFYDIKIPRMVCGTPTYSTQNDFNNSFGSTGRKTGGVITDATGGYIAVTGGTGLLKATNDDNAQLMFCDFPAPTNIQIPSSSTRYIGVEHNGGNPRVVARTTWNWDLDTEFPLGRVINEPINGVDTLHIINNPWWVTDGLTNVIERFRSFGRIRRDDYIGGLILAVTGTRNIAVTEGTLWSNLNEFPISAIDTSVSGTIEGYWYKAGSGWQDSDLTQYSVTQWNDVTQTTLQTIDNNKFCNIWVYAEADDLEIAIIYPQAQYNTAVAAEAVQSPSNLPQHIAQNGILIGRIIIKQGVDAPIAVESAFDNTFTPSAATDHGNLIGLGDDDHTQYLLAGGTRALTGNWDAGSFEVRAQTFESDVATGTAPFTIASTTLNTNLNADLLDGEHASAFQDASSSLTSLAGLSYVSPSFVKMTGANTFTLDTNTYLTGNQSISLSGAVTGSGTTSISTTLAENIVGAGNIKGASSTKLANGSAGNLLKSLGDGTFGWDTNTYLTSLSGALLLDQTTPQTVINGVPTINNGLLVGADANLTDFPNAKMVVSQGDSGYTDSAALNLFGENYRDSGDAAHVDSMDALTGYSYANGTKWEVSFDGGSSYNFVQDGGAPFGVRGIAKSDCKYNDTRGVSGEATSINTTSGGFHWTYGGRFKATASIINDGSDRIFGVYGEAVCENTTSPWNTAGVLGYMSTGNIAVGTKGLADLSVTVLNAAYGIEGEAVVSSSVSTKSAVGGHFSSVYTHVGGSNIGISTLASGGATNYGVYSNATDYSFYGVEGKIYNEDQVLVGSDASLTDFPNAQAIFSQSNTGETSTASVGIVGEGVYGVLGQGNMTNGLGVKGIGLVGGSFKGEDGLWATGTATATAQGRGVYANGSVTDTSNTESAIGIVADSVQIHAGGNNFGGYFHAEHGAINYGVYSLATNYSFYGEEGKIYNEDFVLFGTTANNTDFTRAQLVSSTGNTGDTNTAFIGVVGESVASNGVANAMGLRGIATTDGANASFGVVGRGYVGATADTGIAYGGYFYATTTHAGANNIGVYANASGGAENYDFYGVSGNSYASGLKTREDSGALADDATIALPTGVAGILQVWTEAEFGQVYVTTAGVVTLIAGSANFAITDSDTDLCVYDGGTGAVIKNRLGSSKTVRYSYKYS